MQMLSKLTKLSEEYNVCWVVIHFFLLLIDAQIAILLTNQVQCLPLYFMSSRYYRAFDLFPTIQLILGQL